MLWHYHDDDVPGPAATVRLSVDGLSADFGRASVEHFRIDERHSNAYSLWKRMGEPQNPTVEQYAELEAGGRLERLGPKEKVRSSEGRLAMSVLLPRQAVSLLVIEGEEA